MLQTNHPSLSPRQSICHVLLNRLDPLLQKHRRHHQSGFTHCCSTLDAILALCLLVEIHREFQQPLHVTFVDLKAAFDSVDRNTLWKAMRGVGVSSVLMNLIVDLHTATSARVRLAGCLSEPFTTTSGVRQGCVLAPTLFCRAMVTGQVQLTVLIMEFHLHYLPASLLLSLDYLCCHTASWMWLVICSITRFRNRVPRLQLPGYLDPVFTSKVVEKKRQWNDM